MLKKGLVKFIALFPSTSTNGTARQEQVNRIQFIFPSSAFA